MDPHQLAISLINDKQMKNNLRDTLFGFRTRRVLEEVAAFKANSPSRNSAGAHTRRRTPRVIGITEQRLRAYHQPSWITDINVWRRLFARFATFGARPQIS